MIWICKEVWGYPKIVNQAFYFILGCPHDGTPILLYWVHKPMSTAWVHHINESAQQACDRSCSQPENVGPLDPDRLLTTDVLNHYHPLYSGPMERNCHGSTWTMARKVHGLCSPNDSSRKLVISTIANVTTLVSSHQVQTHLSLYSNFEGIARKASCTNRMLYEHD